MPYFCPVPSSSRSAFRFLRGCIISRAIIQSEFDNHSAQRPGGPKGSPTSCRSELRLPAATDPRNSVTYFNVFPQPTEERQTDHRGFRSPNNENATTLPRTITVTTAAPSGAGPGFGDRSGLSYLMPGERVTRSVYRNREFNGISTGELLDWFRPNSNVVPNNAVN